MGGVAPREGGQHGLVVTPEGARLAPSAAGCRGVFFSPLLYLSTGKGSVAVPGLGGRGLIFAKNGFCMGKWGG